MIQQKYKIKPRLINKFYPMTNISHFIGQLPTNLICIKGGTHQQQPLNLVCLDLQCRNNPLCCCVCFTNNHKYHKVVSFNKFLDDYKRNIRTSNIGMLQKKINKQYLNLKTQIDKFKSNVHQQIIKFQKAIEKYAQYLSGQSQIRGCVSQYLKVQLEPQQIQKIKSMGEVQRSIKFILNNCLYDSNLNMISTSEMLRQNEERVCALLDKMVYMTQYCQLSINEALQSLQFVNNTLKVQKLQLNKIMDKLISTQSDSSSLQNFMVQKMNLSKLIQDKSSLILNKSQKIQALHQWNQIPDIKLAFLFGKHRHKQLLLKDNGKTVCSNIQGNKYFALGQPYINYQPRVVRQFAIKIKKCRDFASQNTMAIGIGRLQDIKQQNYRGDPKNCLLVSSQGYITLNGKITKSNFIFRQGDIIYFNYDPHYGIIDIYKDNGRKLTLPTLGEDQPVYFCARLTYASDQVQFI